MYYAQQRLSEAKNRILKKNKPIQPQVSSLKFNFAQSLEETFDCIRHFLTSCERGKFSSSKQKRGFFSVQESITSEE